MNTSAQTQPSDTEDQSRRFLFEHADIRGQMVQLGKAYRELLAIHQYPYGVSRLLGEFLSASVLLSSNLKFDGKLILQVRSEGQVPLLMAECDDTLQVRAIARGAQQAISDDFDLLLRNGHLAITIDPTRGQRYQGIVPLLQGSLARSLDNYFEHSEQLKTRIWLAADGHRASGLLLQQLPPQATRDDTLRREHWDHVCNLAATVTGTELLTLAGENLLHRLYHQDPVRLFAPTGVRFQCSCSRGRTRHALSTLSTTEILDLLDEQGSITLDCEFCNQSYRFARNDLADLLESDSSKTLH
jgi:molecular chaperone Hsp33